MRDPRKDPQVGDMVRAKGYDNTNIVTKRNGDRLSYRCGGSAGEVRDIKVTSWQKWRKEREVEVVGPQIESYEKNPKVWTNPYLLERYYSLLIARNRIDDAIAECKEEINRRLKKGWKLNLSDFPELKQLHLYEKEEEP